MALFEYLSDSLTFLQDIQQHADIKTLDQHIHEAAALVGYHSPLPRPRLSLFKPSRRLLVLSVLQHIPQFSLSSLDYSNAQSEPRPTTLDVRMQPNELEC